MADFDRITTSPGVMNGRACIRGMRLTVSHIVNLVASGMTPVEILAEYPDLEMEDIRQALSYAAALASGETPELVVLPGEPMAREEVIAVLRNYAPALKAAGVVSASLFGSLARNEPQPRDVDIAVRLAPHFSTGGLDYFWQRDQLRQDLQRLLGRQVDIVEEPARRATLQAEIDRDRALVF